MDLINYENLTWPDVAALPRDIPLVIPLGSGYDFDMLSEQLGCPARAAILPAVPFGWRGSGLAVPESIFANMIHNLLASLREDGFSNVYCLAPGVLDPQMFSQIFKRVAFLAQPHSTQYRDPAYLPPDDARGMVILIPIGHTEQHGHHLPLSVDTVIIDAIARGTVNQLATRTFAMPVMPYGVSTHRNAFAATLNAGGRAFEDFWLAAIDSLVARGFTRFYFLSGHGGNMSFLVNVVKYAGERHRQAFCATTWLHTAGHVGAPALEKYRKSKIGGMGHAGELETSYMLHLQPELCHMERVVDEIDFISTPNFYMDWIEGGALVANPPWDDDSKTGAYGAGSLGTAEKGRLWLEAAIQEKVDHVKEIHTQFEKRQARRASGFGLWGKTS
jgi:creatinine amidohydrolase